MSKLISKYLNPAKKLTDFDEMNNYAQEDAAEFYEKNAYYDHQDDWGRRLRNIGLENKRSEISNLIFDKLYNTNIVDENNSVGELNYPFTDIKDDKNRDIYTKLIYGYNHSIGKALPKEINDWNKKLVNGSLMTEFMRPAAVTALIKSKKLNIPLEEYLNDPKYENDMDVIELKKLFKDNNGNVDTKKMFYFLDNFALNNNPQQFNDSPLYAKKGARLIPKAQLGTLLKKGITWIGNHMAPTLEQTMFLHWNNQRAKLQSKQLPVAKNEGIKSLQRDLIKYGYLAKGQDDGIIGPKTRRAILQALNDGFKIDTNRMIMSKPKSIKKKDSKNVVERIWNTMFGEKTPSQKEFIAQKLQLVRDRAALINKETVTPQFPLGNFMPNHDFDYYGSGSEGTASAKNMTEKLVALLFTKYRDEALDYLTSHPNISNEAKRKVLRNINYFEKVIKDPRTVARKGTGIGFGCVYSATGSYDLDNLPLSTRNKLVFANNKQLAQSILTKEDSPYLVLPFVEQNLKVGDIIQLGRNDTKIGPHHAVMVTGFDWLGRPKVTATNAGTAGIDDRAIDSHKEYIRILQRANDDGDLQTPGILPQGLQVVRFVGDSNLINLWKREYNTQYNR